MRYRIDTYTIEGQTISFDMPSSLGRDLTIEDIRLIINETQRVVICSSMQKSNVSIVNNTIVVSDEVCELRVTDKYTIEVDFGGEVDLSSIAKQGTDDEATNTAIYEKVKDIPELKNIYSARFEKNDDNVNTYTMVLPLVAGVEENGENTVTITI